MERNRRILVIDDNCAIHEDIRRILAPSEDTSQLDALEARAFGNRLPVDDQVRYSIDTACQGEDGLRMVCDRLELGEHYSVAFIDMRMPPGWDGVETIEKIWQHDPSVQVVICTAFSDHSWNDLIARLGRTDRLFILKKPFDSVEVSQLACALTEKWHAAQFLHSLFEEVPS